MGRMRCVPVDSCVRGCELAAGWPGRAVVNCGNCVHLLWTERISRLTGSIRAFQAARSERPAAILVARRCLRLLANAGLGRPAGLVRPARLVRAGGVRSTRLRRFGAAAFAQAGDVKLGPAPDEPVRVIEVIGRRQQVRVGPDRVPAGYAADLGEPLPDSTGLAAPPRAQLKADQGGKRALGRGAGSP